MEKQHQILLTDIVGKHEVLIAAGSDKNNNQKRLKHVVNIISNRLVLTAFIVSTKGSSVPFDNINEALEYYNRI